MKKILSICVLVAFVLASAFTTQAQNSLISVGNSLAKDTVTNTAAKQWVKKLPGFNETITLQVVVTKISGTLGGTIIPVVSNDGVTWSTSSVVSGSTSFTVTDVTSQNVVFYPSRGFLYYGFQWTGTGTMSGSAAGNELNRKSTQ